jgi:drug/metabolite transporter (DMT)-like permease
VSTSASPDRQALLYGMAAIVLWSTVATAFKLALRHLDVYQLLFYASAVSSIFLLAVVFLRGQQRLLLEYLRATPVYFLLVAALNPSFYYLVLFSAYDLLPAQQAQAINYSWGIVLALFSIPFLGQRMDWRDCAAGALGYAGVLIVATRGNLRELQFESLEGVALALFSTLIWAAYWIISTRNQRDSVVSMCLNFTLATPICLALCLLFSTPVVSAWQGLAGALWVGLFEMGLTFALWATALKKASRVARVSNLIFLSPFLSLVLIYFILDEAIHPATVVGLLLIIPGALLQQFKPAAKAPVA